MNISKRVLVRSVIGLFVVAIVLGWSLTASAGDDWYQKSPYHSEMQTIQQKFSSLTDSTCHNGSDPDSDGCGVPNPSMDAIQPILDERDTVVDKLRTSLKDQGHVALVWQSPWDLKGGFPSYSDPCVLIIR